MILLTLGVYVRIIQARTKMLKVALKQERDCQEMRAGGRELGIVRMAPTVESGGVNESAQII